MESKLLGKTLTAAEWLNYEFVPYIGRLWAGNHPISLRYNGSTNTAKIVGERISMDIVMMGDYFVEADRPMQLVITDADGLGLKKLLYSCDKQ